MIAKFKQFFNELWERAKLLLLLLLVLCVVHLINIVMGMSLNQYGIYPRQMDQWWHIFTAPFLHGSNGHLLNNLVGLFVFGSLCLFKSRHFFIWACMIILLVSGVLVWSFARPAYHIGASGIIFGLWALTIANAYFEASIKSIVLSISVIFLYGGMIYGVLPQDKGVSFEAHAFGVIGGILAAFALHKLKIDSP